MNVIRFTRGAPPSESFVMQDVIECCAAALRQHGAALLNYYPAAGFEPLRACLAEQARVDPNQVIISNGSLQLFHFLAQLLAGQSTAPVLVERPSYDRAVLALKSAGAQVLGVPLEPDGVDSARLADAVKASRPQAFYVVSDFQNPTGITTCLEKRLMIAALAREYGFWIIEDCPYRRLRYRGDEIPTLFELAPDRTLHLSSLSKVLSPGIRLGWLLGPAPLVARLVKMAEDTYVSPNTVSQGLAYEFLCSGHLEPNIERLKSLYAPRLDAILAALDACLPDAQFARPEGGFYVGITLAGGPPMPQLLDQARAVNLMLTDGRGFFDDGGGDYFVRLPFCNLTLDEIKEGIERLAKIVHVGRQAA